MLETEKLEVLEETSRILASEPFRRAKRMSDLLRFLVDETLAGRAESLKEVLVGVQVFGRDPGFDPQQDPVVRNEMRRLRSKLLEYYANSSAGRVVVEIPKGAYKPIFRYKYAVAKSSRLRYVTVSAAAVAMLLATLVALSARRTELLSGTGELRVQPIATDPGVLWHPAISPDGESVAYAWGATEVSRAVIYVGRIGGIERRRLSATPGTQLSPVWSPSGKEIAFLRRGPDNQGTVIVAAIDGTSERVLGQGAISPNVAGTQLSWSPDGKWLAAAVDKTITLFPIPTGDCRVFRFSEFSPYSPRFSPDGRQIAMAGSVGVLGHAIYRSPVTTDGVLQGKPVRVTPEGMTIAGAYDWTGDGNSLVVAAGTALDSRLWKVAVQDGKSELLRVPGDELRFPHVSANRLVFAKWNRDADIWRMPLLPDRTSGKPEKLISSVRVETDPQYSPDGDRLCFVSHRSGHSEIWIAGADGSGAVPITNMKGPLLDCPRWSPDSLSIVFQTMLDGRFQAFLVNVHPRTLRQLTADPKITRAAPSFSHDGKWVYFTSARSGGNEIWKTPSQGGADVQITLAGGLRAWESDDGQKLFIEKEAPRGLWERSLASGEEKLLISSHPGDPFFTNAGIWFNTARGIQFLDQSTMRLQPVYASPTFMQSMRHEFSISPDRRYAVFAQYTENRSELLLVDGFR